MRTPRPLTAALAAALAAGVVVAVSAVADPGEERPPRAATARFHAAPPPTRAEAVKAAVATRDDVERRLSAKLGVDVARLRAAERAVVADRLEEEVAASRLTAAQRDAVLACIDDPTGCDRGALPVGGAGGAPPPALPAAALMPPVARPAPRLPARPGRRRGGRGPRLVRIVPPVAAVPVGPAPFVAGGASASALARELGLPTRPVAQALGEVLRDTARAPGGLSRLSRDPDGVPLLALALPVPIVVSTGGPGLVAPRPPVPVRPATPPTTVVAPAATTTP